MLPVVSAPLSLIVNPHSGRGRGVALAAGLREELTGGNREVDLLATSSLEHAAELATLASERGRIAVAVGGDGLISTVAGAVSRAGGLMAVIPAGRGNDFVRSIGLRSKSHALEVLNTGMEHTIDLGRIGETRFTCVASTGIDARVVERANEMRKVPSKVVYPLATLLSLRRFEPLLFKIETESEVHEVKGFTVAVANAPYFGGGMKIAPDADLTDGLFDVVVICKMTKPGFLWRAPRVFRGTHVSHRLVKSFRCKSVEISSGETTGVVADGESVGLTPARFEVLPKALRILLPSNS